MLKRLLQSCHFASILCRLPAMWDKVSSEMHTRIVAQVWSLRVNTILFRYSTILYLWARLELLLESHFRHLAAVALMASTCGLIWTTRGEVLRVSLLLTAWHLVLASAFSFSHSLLIFLYVSANDVTILWRPFSHWSCYGPSYSALFCNPCSPRQ